jgi:hypothetical protein
MSLFITILIILLSFFIFIMRGIKPFNFQKPHWMLAYISLILAFIITTITFAQEGGLNLYIKEGAPGSLIADGKSQTVMMVDISKCSWYPMAGSSGQIQVQFSKSLGIAPEWIFKTKKELGSPFEVTLTAGTQTGTAQIDASASFCPEGAVMAMGVCTYGEEYPPCTGEFFIDVIPHTESTTGEEKPEEEEETSEDLSVSIACPSSPKVGDSITCTASVSGAGEGESLDYIWSLDGAPESKTKSNSFTWKGKETGYHEVAVEVFGKEDRTANKDIRVNLIEGEASEEESTDDSASQEIQDDSSLLSSLEAFLRAAGVSNIKPALLVVAGTGVTALIAIWMIIQNRSGVPMEKLEGALGRWRWREGEKVPESLPEEGKKPPDKLPEEPETKPPDKLQEADKLKTETKPPTTLPEDKLPREVAELGVAAQFDDPTSDQIAASAGVIPRPGKPASGETMEERVERKVDDTEGLRSAVDKTLSDFKKKIEKVPQDVKDSEFWKNKVAPKLKKLDDLNIEGKTAKLKEFLRITKDLLRVRQSLDDRLSILSKKDREGIIWLTRGLQAGQEGLKKIHKQLITDRAINAGKAILPKEQAKALEKLLNQHQKDVETVLEGIKNLPADFAEKGFGAQQRTQSVDDIKRDLYDGIRHNTPTQFMEKGLNNPVVKKTTSAWTKFWKWFGRKGPVFFRDTRPSQE